MPSASSALSTEELSSRRYHGRRQESRLRSKSEGYAVLSQASLTSQCSRGELYRSKERLIRTQPRPPQPSVFCAVSRQQALVLFTLIIAEFISFCSMSVMAPFYPKEANVKGMSPSVSGLVFSFYAFVVFATSPLFGKILPYIGAKFLFMSGLFVAGGCNILFGMLTLMPTYFDFTFFSFLIRTFEAVGASAYATASFVYVVEIFPENICSVLGLLETAMGLGMSVGPALGGLMYSVGGFGLPFYCLGVLMIIIIPSTWTLIPSIRDCSKGTTQASFKNLVRVPGFLVICVIIVVASNTWSFLDPTLEPHLSRLNLTSYEIGLVFLLFSALYGIFSPFWGWLSDKLNSHWSLMVIGLILSSVGLLFLGPSPILSSSKSLALDITGLCIIGVSVALTLMPTFKAILKSAERSGLKRDLSTYSIVAGAWSSMYSLGDMTGPALGGLLSQYFGFSVCSTVMALLSLSVALIAFLFFTSSCTKHVENGTEMFEETRLPLLLERNEPIYGTSVA